eukprot:2675301-Amphidinium_carterae.1
MSKQVPSERLSAAGLSASCPVHTAPQRVNRTKQQAKTRLIRKLFSVKVRTARSRLRSDGTILPNLSPNDFPRDNKTRTLLKEFC